jgi:hypothetical protein
MTDEYRITWTVEHRSDGGEFIPYLFGNTLSYASTREALQEAAASFQVHLDGDCLSNPDEVYADGRPGCCRDAGGDPVGGFCVDNPDSVTEYVYQQVLGAAPTSAEISVDGQTVTVTGWKFTAVGGDEGPLWALHDAAEEGHEFGGWARGDAETAQAQVGRIIAKLRSIALREPVHLDLLGVTEKDKSASLMVVGELGGGKIGAEHEPNRTHGS